MDYLINEEVRDYWRKYPWKFLEDIYGIELLPHQKFMLKHIYDKKWIFPRGSGRWTYYEMLYELAHVLYGGDK